MRIPSGETSAFCSAQSRRRSSSLRLASPSFFARALNAARTTRWTVTRLRRPRIAFAPLRLQEEEEAPLGDDDGCDEQKLVVQKELGTMLWGLNGVSHMPRH